MPDPGFPATFCTQRTGERRELLRGPLQYGLAIAALTAWFWRDSPVGVLGIAVLCAGDGMADIIGRRFGQANKLFYSPQKVRQLKLSAALL